MTKIIDNLLFDLGKIEKEIISISKTINSTKKNYEDSLQRLSKRIGVLKDEFKLTEINQDMITKSIQSIIYNIPFLDLVENKNKIISDFAFSIKKELVSVYDEIFFEKKINFNSMINLIINLEIFNELNLKIKNL